MRHRVSGRKLKRTASHRKALLASLVTSLLRHKKITTTVAKAKETRVLVEKVITRAKRSLAQQKADAAAVTGPERHQKFHRAAGGARREVARFVKDREVVKELFSGIAEKVAERPGGYTRIVKLGQRQGDGAEMAIIELVDYNLGKEAKEKPAPAAKEKKPTTRRKPKKAAKPAKEKQKKEDAVAEKAGLGKKESA